MKKKPLILIVDDIEYNVILLEQILLAEGYRVLSAMNGKKCMEILASELPDVILLDVIMPEINGFDIADKIKQDTRTASIPILFLSAVSEYDVKLKGLEKGAVDYITKPYDSKEVIARIKIHIRIKELEEERLDYIQKLEDLNRDKDNLLQIIAHDMRSPLSSIMLMSEFLTGMTNEVDFDKIHKYSNIIFNSSKKILQLINQLLKTKKIEFYKNEISGFDLVKVIQHSTDLVTRMLEKKSITLELDFFKSEIFVNLDEGKIYQILNNLIYNSIKFTNPNGFIKIKVTLNGDYLHVLIQDNGIGIPSHIQKEIFTRKNTHQRMGTDGEEGSGLGLMITKSLVTNLDGKIEIESEEKKGTTVHLYFYKY